MIPRSLFGWIWDTLDLQFGMPVLDVDLDKFDSFEEVLRGSIIVAVRPGRSAKLN